MKSPYLKRNQPCPERDTKVYPYKILLPIKAFESDSRTSLVDLFSRANFDKAAKGFEKDKTVRDGDFLFKGVKGPTDLSLELELAKKNETMVVIIGTDVLGEAAAILAERQRVKVDIEKLLTMDIGECRMRILAPNESPIRSKEYLEGKRIFTKYEMLLRNALLSWGAESKIGEITRVESDADVYVDKFRNSGNTPIGFDIVQSGSTARKANLQIAETELSYPTIGGFADLNRIATHAFIVNPKEAWADEVRAYRAFGMALESSRTNNIYVDVKFHCRKSETDKFKKFGLSGPTVSPVMQSSEDAEIDDPIVELSIWVKKSDVNRLRPEFAEMGALGFGTGGEIKVDPDPKDSEVLKVLPHGESKEMYRGSW